MNKIILQAHDLFKNAGFDYAICGGFGLDMFANKELRPHGDFDIVVYREDKHRVLKFLADNDWIVFGRFMEEGRMATLLLFYKVENISDSYLDDCKNFWAVRAECLPNVLEKIDRSPGEVCTYKSRKWLVQDEIEFIEFEFDAKEGDDFVLQNSPKITRSLDNAILYRDGIAYLAPEIILFYKTDRFSNTHPNVKPKTDSDFAAIMPLLPDESKKWLFDAVKKAYPDGQFENGLPKWDK